MVEAVICPMPRNSVKVISFSQSSTDVNDCLMIIFMKASGLFLWDLLWTLNIRLTPNQQPYTVGIGRGNLVFKPRPEIL